jgi:hypothetical protein
MARAVVPRLFVLELNAGRIHSMNTDGSDRNTPHPARASAAPEVAKPEDRRYGPLSVREPDEFAFHFGSTVLWLPERNCP